MRKRISAILIALAFVLPVISAMGCYFDNDFYGVYENADRTVSITLKEDNFAAIAWGADVVEYYAEYIIMENKINLRDAKDGFNGVIKHVIRIDQADITKIYLIKRNNTVDETGNITEGEPTETEFVLNPAY